MKLYKSKKDPEVYYYFNKQGEKLWCFRHKYYDDIGKRKEKKKSGFKTEKEAIKSLLDVRALTIRGITKQVEYDNISIGEWLDMWYETNKNTWRPSTQVQREKLIRLHLNPMLGHYKLHKLDKMTYKRAFIDAMIAKKFSISTVKLYHSIFKVAINAAVDNEILSRNRFTKIIIKDPMAKSREKSQENFLTPEELNKLLKTTKEKANITTYTMFLLLAYTGLRRGEAYGLKWKDIDFEEKTLTVDRTRDNTGTHPPKTDNSYRTILIDDLLVQQLKRYKAWCKETLFRFGKKLSKNEFILISYQTGEPITTNLILYSLRKMTKLAKVKEITPHGLRHTHATILISKNVNVKVIADRLGNSPGMILNIYGHSFKKLEEESVGIFGDALKEIGASSGANKK